MTTGERVRQIVAEYRRRLEDVLGDEVHSVILYGSHARGEALEGSDIDVLCVIRNPFHYGDLIDRTSHITAELSLKYDVTLSRSFVSLHDYRERQTPFLMNVRREGVHV